MKRIDTSEIVSILSSLKSGDDKTIYKALGRVASIGSKCPELVRVTIPHLMRLLDSDTTAVCARSCWALGQIGFNRPSWVCDSVPVLARLTDHNAGEVRARAIWALGRIGRACTELIKAYLPIILRRADDADPKVRGSVIWACENIAAERPEWFADAIPAFLKLLDDPDVRYVRREAPEIFRVIGKRRPEIVDCAVAKLTEKLADDDRVVRIHAQGAIDAILVHRRIERE